MDSIAIMTTKDQGVRLASVFGYLEGSAGDGRTVKENERQWERYAIVPRAFQKVANVDSRIRLLGVTSSFPVLVAPVAGQFLIEGVAETATAHGARAAGVPFIRSYQAQSTIADVAAEQPDWMQQVYLPRDRERVLPHLREAVNGFTPLC
jgi:isopentenyl diphosphate isomerase/L-lactate dehydrogenase-like FMN-dependent dehydrogenase